MAYTIFTKLPRHTARLSKSYDVPPSDIGRRASQVMLSIPITRAVD